MKGSSDSCNRRVMFSRQSFAPLRLEGNLLFPLNSGGRNESPPDKGGWGLNPNGEGGFKASRDEKAVFPRPSIRPLRANSG